MHIISRKALVDFYDVHPRAKAPLLAWYRIIEKCDFENFAALRRTFNTIDRVGGFHVFDITGNHYRLICAIHFNTRKVYIRHVFTHAEYDDWRPE